MSDAYAELNEVNPAGTNIIVLVAGVFYQWVTSAVTVQGLADMVVASGITDNFVIQPAGGGLYHVNVGICFDAPNNSNISWSVFLNGVGVPTAHSHCTARGPNLRECMSLTALVALVDGDDIDLRVTSDNAGDVVVVRHITFDLVCQVRDK